MPGSVPIPRDDESVARCSISSALLGSVACVLFLVVPGWAREAFAQVYPYDTKIDCAKAPVLGFSFQGCWISSLSRSSLGVHQSWRFTYSDNVSAAVFGYFKAMDDSFLPNDRSDNAVAAFRLNDAVYNDVRTMVKVGRIESVGNDRFFSFERDSRGEERCKAFIRHGPAKGAGSAHIIVGFFCRRSGGDIPTQEARFLTDQIRVREVAGQAPAPAPPANSPPQTQPGSILDRFKKGF